MTASALAEDPLAGHVSDSETASVMLANSRY